MHTFGGSVHDADFCDIPSKNKVLGACWKILVVGGWDKKEKAERRGFSAPVIPPHSRLYSRFA